MGPDAGDNSQQAFPSTDRERARVTRGTFLFHLRPVRLPRSTARWTHTFGLGGSSLVLWLTLALTGIFMLLVYQPVPDVAYDSVRTLMARVRFGSLVRGVHYWSANLLVAVVLLHIGRVVLTGAYHAPRRLNWIIGVGLLLGVLASAFTGYLLPWDQRAFWAVTISTGMLAYIPGIGPGLQAIVRGGSEIGASTLLDFYTFHTTVLPVLAIVLMAFHFWRVRKAGGVINPSRGWSEGDTVESRYVMFLPDLLMREVAQGLIIVAIVVVLGAVVGAPIGERANPGMSPNPAKAPWYFMGFQELLVHFHPVFAVLVIPFAALAGFLALPWTGDEDSNAGHWFLTPRARRASAVAACIAVIVCAAGVLVDAAIASHAAPGVLLRGILPTVVFAAIAVSVMALGRRTFQLGRNECVQTLIVFLATSFITLTIIGVFFRGEGMRLVWGG